MKLSIIFLGLLAFVAATPLTYKYQAADQNLLNKQNDVIHLLENILGELPNDKLREMGHKYEFESNWENYENPTVIKYYMWLYNTGHVQPKNTPFSLSLNHLRKEAALLSQMFTGAKDYDTFLHTAAWARVHVNQDQFVKAFSSAVLLRPDMRGVTLPAPYEVFPHYFFDSRIIQKVQDFMSRHNFENMNSEQMYHLWVNNTSYMENEESKISYFTEDVGLSAYYAYVTLAGYMVPQEEQMRNYNYQPGSTEMLYYKNGHGAHYWYIHRQMLARYNLERLSQGLSPIKELDYYYEHIETPFKPAMKYFNGLEFPSRSEHLYVTPKHHNYKLLKLIRALERRIVDAIDSGYVMTPQGQFLSLYQPQGYNILGELIEGSGRSVNPRYYGNFHSAARKLFGDAPEFKNIWDYAPSALELAMTSVRDPMFWQLYNKVMEFFHFYSLALPAYQYNDVLVPGVKIEKVMMDDFHTYFSDYEVDLDNAIPQPVEHQQEKQPYPKVKAHMKRLNHQPYEYKIYVQSKKSVPGAVVRTFVGPKYNYDGQIIDFSEHRHFFYEIDQFMWDITEGQNVMTRNSREASGFSFDFPSLDEIKNHVHNAMRSENPFYMTAPQQLFGFPSRLSIPKGRREGFPVQFFVIITAGMHHQTEHYNPVVEEDWMTYQPNHYQVVTNEDYQHFDRMPVDKITSGYRSLDVVPDTESSLIFEEPWHYGYLYKDYPAKSHYRSKHMMMKERHGYTKEMNHENNQEMMMEEHSKTMKEPNYHKWSMHQQADMFKTEHMKHDKMMMSMHHHTEHDYLSKYYENKDISNIIGGVLSLDGKPLGYPFDRPLGHSVFYAHNLYVKDLFIYHNDEFMPEN